MYLQNASSELKAGVKSNRNGTVSFAATPGCVNPLHLAFVPHADAGEASIILWRAVLAGLCVALVGHDVDAMTLTRLVLAASELGRPVVGDREVVCTHISFSLVYRKVDMCGTIGCISDE